MQQLTKQIKKLIKEYSEIAYDRELSQALEDLRKEFDRWQKNQVAAFDLSDTIHQFHEGISRELWWKYNMGKGAIGLTMAIASGIIARDELPSDLLDFLSRDIEFFETRRQLDD